MFVERFVEEKSKGTRKFSMVTIENIELDFADLENYISRIFIETRNLNWVFDSHETSNKEVLKKINRFLPLEEIDNLDDYIESEMNLHNSFYSFYAEALMALILRDIYSFDLVSAVLELSQTLIDVSTGADGCFIDEISNTIILGEAKFYKNKGTAIRKIVNNFLEDGLINKLNSLKRNIDSDDESTDILLHYLDKNDSDTIELKDLMRMNFIFAGFVLHEHTGKTNKYESDSYYDKYKIEVVDIKEFLNNNLNFDVEKTNMKIIILHLPILNKKNLIKKIIEEMYRKKEEIRGKRHE